ncbi:MAG TPA: amidohydrolase family protein, partial [Flavipsychrobacter sp.]
AISDMPWAGDRLGKQRLPTAYAYKKLLEQNGWIALGTDFPVEAINPLATFYTAIARKDRDGHPEKGFLPENKLSRKEALLGMTYWAAKSVFWEKEKGSLEPGKDADIIILDKDIMTIPEKGLLNVNIIYTIVKGKTVYKKNGS